MNTQHKQANADGRGFTIIEVVLVLAIAGLIFLMVFIALPALQRGQRDTSRKSDAGIVSSAITGYTSNNRGAFPSTTNLTGVSTGVLAASGGYVNSSSVSQSTTTVTVVTSATAPAATTTATYTATDGVIAVYQGYKCDPSVSTGPLVAGLRGSGNKSKFATVTYVEAGGSGAYHCQDN